MFLPASLLSVTSHHAALLLECDPYTFMHWLPGTLTTDAAIASYHILELLNRKHTRLKPVPPCLRSLPALVIQSLCCRNAAHCDVSDAWRGVVIRQNCRGMFSIKIALRWQPCSKDPHADAVYLCHVKDRYRCSCGLHILGGRRQRGLKNMTPEIFETPFAEARPTYLASLPLSL